MYALYIAPALLYSRLFPDSSITPRGQKGIESGRNRAKSNIFLLVFVSPRENRRQQTAKFKIYLIFEGAVLPLWLSLCGGGRVHWVQLVQGTLAILLTLAKMDRIPAFCPLSCLALGGLCLNMALFRVFRAFLARFMGFVWVCVVWVLCVDCGAFCARV